MAGHDVMHWGRAKEEGGEWEGFAGVRTLDRSARRIGETRNPGVAARWEKRLLLRLQHGRLTSVAALKLELLLLLETKA